MRFSIALAAGLLWAGAAMAQTAPTTPTPDATQQTTMPSATSEATTTPTDATTPAATPAVVDHNHEIVCHTSNATGSRLSRHATRVCKTREQWEMEAQEAQRMVQLTPPATAVHD
jgi:hypothetical protein